MGTAPVLTVSSTDDPNTQRMFPTLLPAGWLLPNAIDAWYLWLWTHDTSRIYLYTAPNPEGPYTARGYGLPPTPYPSGYQPGHFSSGDIVWDVANGRLVSSPHGIRQGVVPGNGEVCQDSFLIQSTDGLNWSWLDGDNRPRLLCGAPGSVDSVHTGYGQLLRDLDGHLATFNGRYWWFYRAQRHDPPANGVNQPTMYTPYLAITPSLSANFTLKQKAFDTSQAQTNLFDGGSFIRAVGAHYLFMAQGSGFLVPTLPFYNSTDANTMTFKPQAVPLPIPVLTGTITFSSGLNVVRHPGTHRQYGVVVSTSPGQLAPRGADLPQPTRVTRGTPQILVRSLDQRVAGKAEDALADLACLTGLPNRALFYDRLGHALSRRSEQVAVLFMDLDDFKTVNDTFGHQAGDELLSSVGDAIRRSVRGSDTVARLGGDEFAILIDRDATVETARMLASRLQQAIGAERRIAGHARSIGTSIGISVGTSGLKTAETLMREADVAMYVAKSKGKAGHSVFDPHTHDVVVRTMGLQGDLEHAIRAHQFELNYQPIVSLASGELAGVEALVRWRHPTRGLLQPRDFIHLAELTGAIGALDRWVLEEAGRQARAWGADGATGGNRFLSVNLSPVALVQPGFVTFVRDVLDASGLRAEQLILEVTETVQPDPRGVATALTGIKALGVRLAIDDFGTGFASVSRLLDSPFDVIKIDESLVHAMRSDPRAAAIASGIIDLGRRLGAHTIAEGIEGAAELTELRQMGCDLGQGFHFAPGLPPAELDEQLVRSGYPVTRRRRAAARRAPAG